MTDSDKNDIDHLNSFLRGELSAVETYDQAIEKLSDEPLIRPTLEECKLSHLQRVTELKGEIKRLGGSPADGAGVWGGFAKLVEGGAKVFGKGAAVSALEEGEDHGLNDYRRDRDELTPAARRFVDQRLIPAQQKTHDQLSRLQEIV